MGVFSFANTNTSHARETLKLVAENRCALRHPSILVNNGDQLMKTIASSGVVGKRSAHAVRLNENLWLCTCVFRSQVGGCHPSASRVGVGWVGRRFAPVSPGGWVGLGRWCDLKVGCGAKECNPAAVTRPVWHRKSSDRIAHNITTNSVFDYHTQSHPCLPSRISRQSLAYL